MTKVNFNYREEQCKSKVGRNVYPHLCRVRDNGIRGCAGVVSEGGAMSRDFIYGADLGWVSQLESQGVCWIDENGNQTDSVAALKDMGANAVRLRVFVNPPKEAFWRKPERELAGGMTGGEECMLGFCDKESVLTMAARVKQQNMKLMLDLHYSDHFADPVFQDIPAAWENDDFEKMCKRVAQHTEEVLQLMKAHDICPDWVQVGNEVESGILLPAGSFAEQPEQLVTLLNEGYRAVKACCPSCLVVTHVNCGTDYRRCERFYDTFFAYGGQTDLIGLSYYPYWTKVEHDEQKLQETLTGLAGKYRKPVLLSEIGGPENEAEETYQLLCSVVRAVKAVPDGQGLGLFYWEPEVGADLLPDHYILGAAVTAGENRLRFTKAMSAYADSR